VEKQLVIFELSGEHYGVDIASVESIIKMQRITAVPHAPEFVEGVTNLRGKILPVIDLHKRFGMPVQEVGKDNRIIVVAMQNLEIGIMVDAVSEVITIQSDVVEPPPSIISTVDTAFITGIAKFNQRLIILLDLEQVLSFDQKAELQSFESSAD
jgi:purine-binding chemotaxis protein CheW